MEKEYWINKWHSNDIAFHEQNITPDLISHIKQLKLKEDDCIFVPLCGKTKDMLWLVHQGFYVIGVEISDIACHDFFSESQITPRIVHTDKYKKYESERITLFCADFFDLKQSDFPPVKAIYDCKALIALPPCHREKYLTQILNCFGSDINILLLTREGDKTVKPPPYPISDKEIKLLYSEYFNIQQIEYNEIKNIPERLINKGYTQMFERTYLMEGK